MTKARVLVVEDEAVVALALQKCLENLGHEVTARAATGEEAIRKAREIEPDVILMDIRLKGGMDGIEAARRILESMKIPVIYLTAYSDEKTLERARRTEPYGYLIKPVDEGAVRSAIEMTLHRAVSQTKARNALERTSAILEAIAESVVVVDFSGTVTYMNSRAEALLGLPVAQAAGRHCGQLIRLTSAASGEPVPIPVSRPLLQKESVLLGGLLLELPGGNRREIDLNVSPLVDAAGVATGAALTFHPRPDPGPG